ncbi:sugar ABC transporter ATP-binding protein [Aeromicrobium endophyticum]|uniref:Sugar ABC transporter ATP-binding protein n=1 Tax=Aeromicrobium endophyticum TaxID=2292704 RepID=A0A371PAW3_9ACTN|nr:sugar ABC transporter ATP-binding protein [Aeromicrobium endophyticum]REK73094.1 sugar ABC transporter ATP-binding protein [Aeromicrobium endophyticum]
MTSSPSSARIGDVLVRVDGLVRTYGSTRAVRGASFDVQAGEIHALCGHNGAGKSTVVKMLSGQESPDAGTIHLAGRLVDLGSRQAAQRGGVALVDQELSVVPALTVMENLMLGDPQVGWLDRRRTAARRFRPVLDDLGLGHLRLDQPLTDLGIGERQLVEIARALGQQARLVILDEPTATLSDVESAHVYSAVRKVAASGCSVLFVSHRLGEVLELCDTVTVMRDGDVVATTSTADLTVESLIVQMLGELPERPDRRLDQDTESEVLARIDGLSVPGRVDGMSMTLHAGRVHAVAGQLGSGASEVLRALAGLEPGASGSAVVDGCPVHLGHPSGAARAGIAFASNDRKSEGLFLDKPIAWNLLATRLGHLTRLGVIRGGRWSSSLARLVALCGLDPKRSGHSVGSLSGGNQQKVFVGRSLGRDDVRVLLLDDPTRGVDVGGRAAIHALLRDAADSGMAVLFASTELEELLDLADVVTTMHQGKVVGRHAGRTSGALLLREMTHGSAADEPSAPAEQPPGRAEKREVHA